MSHESLKVIDRRMFTADGELREQLPATESLPSAARPAVGPDRPLADQPPAARPHAAWATDPSPDLGPVPDPLLSPAGAIPDAPGFFDLVGLLAEPASIYLAGSRDADPRTATQSLELARLHIDLLALLRTKTQGNLSPSEQAMLDDVVHQLRAAFVGLRG